MIIAACGGGVLLLIALAVIIVVMVRRRRRKRQHLHEQRAGAVGSVGAPTVGKSSRQAWVKTTVDIPTGDGHGSGDDLESSPSHTSSVSSASSSDVCAAMAATPAGRHNSGSPPRPGQLTGLAWPTHTANRHEQPRGPPSRPTPLPTHLRPRLWHLIQHGEQLQLSPPSYVVGPVPAITNRPPSRLHDLVRRSSRPTPAVSTDAVQAHQSPVSVLPRRRT